MNQLMKIVLKLRENKKCIDNLYNEKKQLEKDFHAEYERLLALCGATGKTIEELEGD